MKRAAATVIFLGALAFAGCQSSSADDCDGEASCCDHHADSCAPGFVCDQQSGECVRTDGGNQACRAPTDCAASFTCGENARCMPGDCYFHGCVTGFECQATTGRWQCAPSPTGGAGAGNQDMTDANTGGVSEAAGQGG